LSFSSTANRRPRCGSIRTAIGSNGDRRALSQRYWLACLVRDRAAGDHGRSARSRRRVACSGRPSLLLRPSVRSATRTLWLGRRSGRRRTWPSSKKKWRSPSIASALYYRYRDPRKHSRPALPKGLAAEFPSASGTRSSRYDIPRHVHVSSTTVCVRSRSTCAAGLAMTRGTHVLSVYLTSDILHRGGAPLLPHGVGWCMRATSASS
jgi:hypothetical protein